MRVGRMETVAGPGTARPAARGKVESKPLSPDAVTMPDQPPETPDPDQPGAQQPEDFKQAALDYHRLAPAGKIKVTATKPMVTQRELALAYSPCVAYACEEIAANPAAAHDYTARGNLVTVISNGTAVLGLGDIGPLAGKPVMEGKGVRVDRRRGGWGKKVSVRV